MDFPLLKIMNSAMVIYNSSGKEKFIKVTNEMKRTLFISILIGFFITSFMSIVGCNYKNKIKDYYRSEGQCKKSCEEWFSSYQQKHDEERVTYKNHYNKRLNKCFILLNNLDYRLKNLRVINENEIYGSFLTRLQDGKIVACDVLENKCNSEKEWDSLVKPYMEE